MNKQNTLFNLPDNPKNNNHEKIYKGKPRIIKPQRDQIEMMMFSIDQLIPTDHKARLVWKYVEKLDLSKLLLNIESTEGSVGRPAIDPHILLALWLYATIEGIGQGRIIERYCSEHNAFKWICGGVDINYHTINDFRANNEECLNELITQSVAMLMAENLITLEEISQDGIKVKAHAGASSFRRKDRLKSFQKIAKAHVEELNKERLKTSSDVISRKKIVEKQKAVDRENRINKAIEHLNKITEQKKKVLKKQRKNLAKNKEDKIRASTTDPESRVMKMGNGGYNPAYNVQLATDIKTQVIVGMRVSNQEMDMGLMSQMQMQIMSTFHKKPKKWLVDGGYVQHEDIDRVAQINPECSIYMPPRNSKDPASYLPKKEDSQYVKEWRINMGKIESKKIYKNRAATSECVNANARNRGLQQFLVRGISKVASHMCLFVIVHNMIRSWSLCN
jgi:transposase